MTITYVFIPGNTIMNSMIQALGNNYSLLSIGNNKIESTTKKC